MAISKTIQTLIWDGDTVTPSGDPSIVIGTMNWESKRNLNDSITRKYIPSDETSTFSLQLDNETRKIVQRTKKTVGWGISIYFRDGTSMQIGDCSIENNSSLDGDGSVDIDIFGNAQWL